MSSDDEIEWEQVDLPNRNELEVVFTAKLTKQKIVELHRASLVLLLSACLYRYKLIFTDEMKAIGMSLGTCVEDLHKVVKHWSLTVPTTDVKDYSLDLRNFNYSKRLLSQEESCLLFGAMMISRGYTIRLVCIIHPFPLSKSSKIQPKYPIEYLIQILEEKNQDWITLDPLSGTVGLKQRDCLYVIGITNNGMTNLTPLFAKQFSTLVPKKTLQHFFKQSVWLFSPSVEDSLQRKEEMRIREAFRDESMPTNLTGFLNHPVFVIKRHLKRNEFIESDAKLIGYFKKEPVYKRSDVIKVFSREYWKRQGRFIKSDIEAVKTVKGKRKRREEKVNEEDLYSYGQTSPWPLTLVGEGEEIPRNSFGNIEVYHPDQIPGGCILLDLCLQAEAKALKIDFVKACMGFEHSRKGSFPVYSGIIVKQCDVEKIVDLKGKTLLEEEEKERKLREIRVYSRWKRLIIGMLGRDRLFKQYM